MIEIKHKQGSLQRMTLSGGRGEGFGGTLALLPIVKSQIVLRPNANKRQDTSPDFYVQCPEWDDEKGKYDWYDCGSAWWKIPEDDQSEIDQYLSISLDRNDLDKKINFAAFLADKEDQPKPDEGGEIWRISYNRPQSKGKKPKTDNRPPLPDDGIEF